MDSLDYSIGPLPHLGNLRLSRPTHENERARTRANSSCKREEGNLPRKKRDEKANGGAPPNKRHKITSTATSQRNNTNEPPACYVPVEPTIIRSQMSNQQQQYDNEDTDDSQRPMYAMSASLSPGAGGERSRR